MIIYQGPSLLDGAPIVAIATGLNSRSVNAKTGDMVQTWIMRSDIAPHVALASGQDYSVCGNCKHRPINGGACYVNVIQAPLSVWKAFQRGVYSVAPDVAAIGRGKNVRLGSYGDPAAVPVEIWQALVSESVMHTGYTHQWNTEFDYGLRGLCMASTDTPEELERARFLGWRSFRVRCEDEPLKERESVCLASDEGLNKLNCATCGACNGADSGRRGSIAIVVHGSRKNRYVQLRKSL